MARFFTIGPRCDECSSRMMLEHPEFRGNTWKCYTCYTCMIIVSSVTMAVGYHGGKGMKGKGTCNDRHQGQWQRRGKGMKGKGKCNDIKGNGNDGGKGNDDGGRLVARGLKRPRA